MEELINIGVKKLGKDQYKCQIQYFPSETSVLFDRTFNTIKEARVFGINYLATENA
jgi:hypothetical protein